MTNRLSNVGEHLRTPVAAVAAASTLLLGGCATEAFRPTPHQTVQSPDVHVSPNSESSDRYNLMGQLNQGEIQTLSDIAKKIVRDNLQNPKFVTNNTLAPYGQRYFKGHYEENNGKVCLTNKRGKAKWVNGEGFSVSFNKRTLLFSGYDYEGCRLDDRKIDRDGCPLSIKSSGEKTGFAFRVSPKDTKEILADGKISSSEINNVLDNPNTTVSMIRSGYTSTRDLSDASTPTGIVEIDETGSVRIENTKETDVLTAINKVIHS